MWIFFGHTMLIFFKSHDDDGIYQLILSCSFSKQFWNSLSDVGMKCEESTLSLLKFSVRTNTFG